MAIRGAADAIATYICWDIADLRDNKYHYGRTGSLQIFTVGNDYMTACKTGKKAPPKCHDDSYNFAWLCIERDFRGWDIYSYSPPSQP